jgi:hypothetical protein
VRPRKLNNDVVLARAGLLHHKGKRNVAEFKKQCKILTTELYCKQTKIVSEQLGSVDYERDISQNGRGQGLSARICENSDTSYFISSREIV